MSKTISEMTAAVTAFADERGWLHESPTQLLAALMAELGELSEHYQWLDRFEEWPDEKRREVGYEFVDVVFLLFRLAGRSGIDIGSYFDEKLPKLAEKFPVAATQEEHERRRALYRQTGRNRLYDRE